MMIATQPMARRITQHRPGLTLLELLGVLVILSLVATVATVSLRHIASRSRIRHTVDRMQWLHESTRRLAASTEAEWQLEFQPQRGQCLRRRSGDKTATVMSGELQVRKLLHTRNSPAEKFIIRYRPSGTSDWCLVEIAEGNGILLSGTTSQTLYPVETSDAEEILREAE